MNKLTPNSENINEDEFDQLLKSTADGKLYRRLLAIHALISGLDPKTVSTLMKTSLRTLYNWVARWNTSGVDGLVDKKKTGRPASLTKQEKAKIVELMENPKLAGESFWTAYKLHGFLTDKESMKLGYSTLTRFLHEEQYTLKRTRSWPENQDPNQRASFVIELEKQLRQGDKEIWFGDESGFLADPRPTRIWAKKGTRPTTPHTGMHLRESVVGAVCPQSGEMSALVIGSVDSTVFQVFIDMLAEQTKNKSIILVLDNASWHKVNSLKWHNIQPMYLPPYSPDLNPIERLWKVVKQRYFTQWFTKDRDSLITRICDGLLSFFNDKNAVKKLCAV